MATARGEPVQYPGWFAQLAFIVDITRDTPDLPGKASGPVPTVYKCSDENEVDSPVNNLNFGFTGYISSGDFDWALRVCEEFYTGLSG